MKILLAIVFYFISSSYNLANERYKTCYDNNGYKLENPLAYAAFHLQENNRETHMAFHSQCSGAPSTTVKVSEKNKKSCEDCMAKVKKKTPHAGSQLLSTRCGGVCPPNAARLWGLVSVSTSNLTCSGPLITSKCNYCGDCEPVEELLCLENQIINQLGECESCSSDKIANKINNICECPVDTTLNNGICVEEENIENPLVCDNPEFLKNDNGDCSCPESANPSAPWADPQTCYYSYNQFIKGEISCPNGENPYLPFSPTGKNDSKNKSGLCSVNIPTVSKIDELSNLNCPSCIGGTAELDNLSEENALININNISCEGHQSYEHTPLEIKLNINFDWEGTTKTSHAYNTTYRLRIQCLDMRLSTEEVSLVPINEEDGFPITNSSTIASYSVAPSHQLLPLILRGEMNSYPPIGSKIGGNENIIFTWAETCYNYRFIMSSTGPDGKWYNKFSNNISIDYNSCTKQAYPDN